MEMLELANGEPIDAVKAKLDALENDENVIFMTDFYYELTRQGFNKISILLSLASSHFVKFPIILRP